MSDRPTPMGRRHRRRAIIVALGLVAIGAGTFFYLFRPPEPVDHPDNIVQDPTHLVRIEVGDLLRPASTGDVQEALRGTSGIVSIGGARFSMGGQIATEGATFLDTRARLNDILELEVARKRIRVESGATWRDVQEAIDPHNLSVKIMQSYNNFSVGGTLSVNAHGRYVNLGPVIHSVRSFTLVLADGTAVHCSREDNAELFYAAIGGYGGIGVITEVDLDLVDNIKVERAVERMPVGEFVAWFDVHIRPSRAAVFFNADLYPPDYEELVAITFSETERDLTIADRLQSKDLSTSTDRFTYWLVSEVPLGKRMRSDLFDRMRLGGRPVVWRNYEASYDVGTLEPTSREKKTYVLQEYFIPVEHFDAFVPKMARVFRKHDVTVVNVSIRHAAPDPDSLLSWAPTERFCFVIYYKQGTDDAAQVAVGVWTRALIDEALSVGGTYYLPYQALATPDQFRAAYPRAREFFALKERVDPDYRFRNKLWDKYYENP